MYLPDTRGRPGGPGGPPFFRQSQGGTAMRKVLLLGPLVPLLLYLVLALLNAPPDLAPDAQVVDDRQGEEAGRFGRRMYNTITGLANTQTYCLPVLSLTSVSSTCSTGPANIVLSSCRQVGR